MAQQAKWDVGLYDDKHSFVWKMAGDLLPLLAAKPGERILDVGCGTAHLTSQIAAAGAVVTGIDQSTDMIRQAKEKYPEISFAVMDAREIRFAEQFDAVFSNATLHWIKEPEQVIAGVASVLKPAGRFVAEFGGKGNIGGLVAAVERAWAALGIPGPMPNPWYYPSVAEYASLLEKHGLEVTSATLFDRPTPLEDGERGLRTWLDMFGSPFLGKLPADQKDRLILEIERRAHPTLFHHDTWVLDYRRLRIVSTHMSIDRRQVGIPNTRTCFE